MRILLAVDGSPHSQAAVDEADTWGADLIVVGSHGHTGMMRWLLGSVATAIVRHASCSVEVVRKRESVSRHGRGFKFVRDGAADGRRPYS